MSAAAWRGESRSGCTELASEESRRNRAPKKPKAAARFTPQQAADSLATGNVNRIDYVLHPKVPVVPFLRKHIPDWKLTLHGRPQIRPYITVEPESQPDPDHCHLRCLFRTCLRQLPQRLHLPPATPRIARPPAIALPTLRHHDSRSRQHSPAQLDRSPSALPPLPPAHRLALSGSGVRNGGAVSPLLFAVRSDEHGHRQRDSLLPASWARCDGRGDDAVARRVYVARPRAWHPLRRIRAR